jgi:hypothetical protein
MHPVKTGGKRKKTVLAVILALGVGMPTPAQAYLLDFTVASINPGVLISYAGGGSPGPLQVESNPMVSGDGATGDLGCQLSPIPPHLLASLDVHRLIVNDTCVPGFAASFASAPGASAGATVPGGVILTHLAPFSSTLMLLGCGLMGLAGLRYRRRRG